jgi:alpha-ribazole phosphatase
MVYLTRHTTPRIDRAVCYGRLDVPLADSAADEIAAVLARLPTIACTVASPATRCAALAAAVADRDGAQLRADPRLLELDMGAWEGVRWDEIDRSDIDAWSRDPWQYRVGGGESLRDLWARVADFRSSLTANPHPTPLLIVAHHGPLRALICQARGWPPERFFDVEVAMGAAGVRPLE